MHVLECNLGFKLNKSGLRAFEGLVQSVKSKSTFIGSTLVLALLLSQVGRCAARTMTASMVGFEAVSWSASSSTMYVTNFGLVAAKPLEPSITAYPLGNAGNVIPGVTIKGDKTGLEIPQAIAVDSSGKLYVVNCTQIGSVLVYSAGSNGNVAPTATIDGGRTGLGFPDGIAVDSKGNIYLINIDNDVTIFPVGSNGDAKASAVIEGPDTGLDKPRAIAVDANGEIYVANIGRLDSRNLAAGYVTVYAPGSNGNARPIATIGGVNTGIGYPYGLALDSSGQIYVTSMGNGISRSKIGVTGYPAHSTGNVPPSVAITDPLAGIPWGVAVDSSGRIYVTGGRAATDGVSIYAPSTNGDVTPIASFSGVDTGLQQPHGIAIGR
jgi:sugar lactone lactonase YvrE